MIEIIQFQYSRDNLGYVLISADRAIAVDPGADGYILNLLRQKNLELKAIVNTHGHSDHTGGNVALQRATGAGILDPAERSSLRLGADEILIIPTPGHTEDSVCFSIGSNLLTGDTLFIANIGNCPPARMGTFHNSLRRILALPDDTVVYPGHDYTERSLKRAGRIEKNNPDLKKFQKTYRPPPVASTIGTEKKINPYLRTDRPAVIDYLKRHNKNVGDSFQRFKSFLEL